MITDMTTAAPSKWQWRPWIPGLVIGILALAVLACNLPVTGNPTSTVARPTASDLPSDGTRPRVQIESPSSGAQALNGQPFMVRVHAFDNIGITRVEMRESGRVVVTQPSPDPNPDFVAILTYRPISIGTVSLEVVAYRKTVASDPVAIIVEVVGSAAELKNPNSLNPTSGLAAGAPCSAQITVSGLNLRGGPGTNYPSLAKLNVGEIVSVVARNGDSSWFQVKPTSNPLGWVSTAYVNPNGDCSTAPVVTAPPPP